MSVQIPEFLKKMLTDQYGDETAFRILNGYTRQRPVTLRVNTLKSDVTRVKAKFSEAEIIFQDVPWSAEVLILEQVREPAVRTLDIYENGEIYLQSLSSMIPPILLEPKEKECILDMAAAPGGKTTQMAALSDGLAQITACEKNKVRAERLKYNLDKQGASKVLVMTEDARKLDPFFSFDKILLDAPCSGSGTIYIPGAEDDGGQEPAAGQKAVAGQEAVMGQEAVAGQGGTGNTAGNAARNAGRQQDAITRELIDRSARTQEALLRKALELLKPGGEMIYSTCSVLKVENEQVLNRVLPGARAKIIPIEHTMTQEIPLLPTTIKGTLCICPTELYEGFFVAKIRKSL